MLGSMIRARGDGADPRHGHQALSVAKEAKASSRTTRQRLRRVGQRPSHPPFEAGVEALDNLVLIGASAGGLAALTTVLHSLPLDFSAPVVIILHQYPRNPFELAPAVERMTHLPIVVVVKRVALRRGVIYVLVCKALFFVRGNILASAEPAPPGALTTIDRTFASAAGAHGDRVIGVVLTGLLRDGTAGLRAVHDAGGLTIVQDPAEAEYPDMPANAMRELPVTFCLRASDIGLALDVLARRHTTLETGLAHSARMLKERVALLVRLLTQSNRSPTTSEFLLSEIRALEFDLHEVQILLDEVRTVSSSHGGDEVPGQAPC